MTSTPDTTASTSGPTTTPTSGTRPALVVLVACAAAFMASLDVFIVNVAFDDIGADFTDASLSQLSWVLNAYAIVYAALLVPAGRLADRYGLTGAFALGLALFTAASVACAAAPGIWTLVAFRGVQAVGAAVLTPASLGLVIAAAPATQRTSYVRIWAATGAIAAALGPVAGGLLVEADWRWVFLVNLPIGLAALVATRPLPRVRADRDSRIPDLPGAALLAVSIGALSLGIVQGPDWGWSATRTITAWIVAAGGLAAFTLSSRRHRTPVIDPALLRVRAFSFSNVTALLFSITFAGALLASVLWMQQVWHYSAIRTGLGIAPGPMLVPVCVAIAQRVGRRIPVGLIVAIGCAMFALGALLIAADLDTTPAYASTFLPGWLVGGVGVGFALPSILSNATSDLSETQAATGSAIVNMSRQIGTALGVSLLIATIGTPTSALAAQHAFRHGWWVLAAAGLAATLAAPAMTPRTPAARAGAATPTADASTTTPVSAAAATSAPTSAAATATATAIARES